MYCTYCQHPAHVVNGRSIHPHDPKFYDRLFWSCTPCDAHVLIYMGDRERRPVGRIANPELRRLQLEAKSLIEEYGHFVDWGFGIRNNGFRVEVLSSSQCQEIISSMGRINDFG